MNKKLLNLLDDNEAGGFVKVTKTKIRDVTAGKKSRKQDFAEARKVKRGDVT